jgi:hypothetical protein
VFARIHALTCCRFVDELLQAGRHLFGRHGFARNDVGEPDVVDSDEHDHVRGAGGQTSTSNAM